MDLMIIWFASSKQHENWSKVMGDHQRTSFLPSSQQVDFPLNFKEKSPFGPSKEEDVFINEKKGAYTFFKYIGKWFICAII